MSDKYFEVVFITTYNYIMVGVFEMFTRLLTAILLVMSISAATTVMADDNSWLVGTWQLDSSSKTEYLEFTQDRVTLISGNGTKVSGDYELKGDAIKIEYRFKGKKIPVELNYAASKDTLHGNMATTGKTVRYTKG